MNIKIASAPVSWGVIMKDAPNVPQDKARLNDLNLRMLAAYVQINLLDPMAKRDEYDETIATMRYEAEAALLHQARKLFRLSSARTVSAS